jgi:hypothetical protein
VSFHFIIEMLQVALLIQTHKEHHSRAYYRSYNALSHWRQMHCLIAEEFQHGSRMQVLKGVRLIKHIQSHPGPDCLLA